MGKKKSTSSQSSTAHSVSTPTLPGYAQGPVQNLFGQIGSLRQPQTYGATGLQNQAFTGAAGLTPNANTTQGLEALRGLLGQGGQVAGADLSPYTNPWENSVVQSATDAIERQRAAAIAAGQGDATRAGAYGGSRHGVADSLTNEAALRATGETVGGLRSAGYQNAQQMRLADIANALGISQSNLQAGVATDANQRANLGTQADLGSQQREIQQSTDPEAARAQFLANLRSIYGISLGDLTSQTVDSQGHSTGTQTQSGSGLDTLGQLGGIFSSIFSPVKLSW